MVGYFIYLNQTRSFSQSSLAFNPNANLKIFRSLKLELLSNVFRGEDFHQSVRVRRKARFSTQHLFQPLYLPEQQQWINVRLSQNRFSLNLPSRRNSARHRVVLAYTSSTLSSTFTFKQNIWKLIFLAAFGLLIGWCVSILKVFFVFLKSSDNLLEDVITL